MHAHRLHTWKDLLVLANIIIAVCAYSFGDQVWLYNNRVVLGHDFKNYGQCGFSLVR